MVWSKTRAYIDFNLSVVAFPALRDAGKPEREYALA
jgi:hypothetical protein